MAADHVEAGLTIVAVVADWEAHCGHKQEVEGFDIRAAAADHNAVVDCSLEERNSGDSSGEPTAPEVDVAVHAEVDRAAVGHAAAGSATADLDKHL